MIEGDSFDESKQGGDDRLRNRLRAHRPEGTGGFQGGSHIVDLMESRFPRGELGKVAAPDRAAVLLWGSRIDDELAGWGEHPRRLASKPGELEVVHSIEAGHHVTAGGPERERFDGPDQVPRMQTRASVADARLPEHGQTQIQANGNDLHGKN